MREGRERRNEGVATLWNGGQGWPLLRLAFGGKVGKEWETSV